MSKSTFAKQLNWFLRGSLGVSVMALISMWSTSSQAQDIRYFGDNYLSGSSSFIDGGSTVQILSNSTPLGALTSTSNLKVRPMAWYAAGLKFGNGAVAINQNNKFLHFYVQRQTTSQGKLLLYINGWNLLELNATNAASWRVDGLVPTTALSGVEANKWVKVVVDLGSLNVTQLNGVGILGDQDDSPTSGNIYFLDEVFLSKAGYGFTTNTNSVSWLYDEGWRNGTTTVVAGSGASVQPDSTVLTADGSHTSVKIVPAPYYFAGVQRITAINASNKYLSLRMRRSANSTGQLLVIQNGNWGAPITLNASNAAAWRVNGLAPTAGLSSIPATTWNDISIDLSALGVTNFTALVVMGGTAGENYNIDDVRLEDMRETTTPPKKCINIGAALEAPPNVGWGYDIITNPSFRSRVDADFGRIKAKGFDTIRLPVNWADRASNTAPYTIDANFMAEVDNVIHQALKNGLKVILNVHNFSQFDVNPNGQKPKLDAMWSQILARYRNYPPELMFEYLNEPHFDHYGGSYSDTNGYSGGQDLEASNINFGIDLMNNANQGFVNTARAMSGHKARWLILGSSSYGNSTPFLQGGANGLFAKLPNYDARAIMTYHYYDPFYFTHQQLSFMTPALPPYGNFGTQADVDKLYADMYGTGQTYRPGATRGQGMPVLIGEFGTGKAYGGLPGTPYEDRLEYANWMADAAKQQNLGACYWDFASPYFGIFDVTTNQWIGTIADQIVQ